MTIKCPKCKHLFEDRVLTQIKLVYEEKGRREVVKEVLKLLEKDTP